MNNIRKKGLVLTIILLTFLLLLTGCAVNNDKPTVVPNPDDTPTPELLFTVKYVSGGKTFTADFKDYRDIKLSSPTPPPGYSFLGWATPEGILITENNLAFLGEHNTIELHAQWHATSYLINININQGQYDGVLVFLYNAEMPTFALPTPTRAGYTFMGWRTNTGELITLIEQGTYGNLDLTAEWSPLEYFITYDLLGGTCDTLINKYTLDMPTFALPSPTKPGATFLGWYSAADYSGDKITTVTPTNMVDLMLHAKWKITNYLINYNMNGGYAPNLPSHYNLYTDDINLTVYKPLKHGQKFQGFYLTSDAMGQQVTMIDHTSTINYTLHAAWTDSDTTDNVQFIYHPGDGGYYTARATDRTGMYVVPNIYKNKPVQAVEDRGFAGMNNANITIKDGVELIGDYAFSGSVSTAITLQYGIKKIGQEAMADCHNISAIIPGSLGKNLGNGIFMNTSGSSISLKYGIVTLPEDAFNGYVGDKITLPASIEKIADNALSNMSYTSEHGINIAMGGSIKYFGKVTNSRIATIAIDSGQDHVPHSFIKQLFYLDSFNKKLFMTNLIITNKQLQGITSTIFSTMTGFVNHRFRTDLECKALLSDRETIVGHFSMSHPEQVCLRVKYDSNSRDRILFNLGTMNTLSHEIRHYFQKLHVHGSIGGVSKDSVPRSLRPNSLQVADWHKPYITEPYPDYYHQPVEEDARQQAHLLTGYNPYHTPCEHPVCSDINSEYPATQYPMPPLNTLVDIKKSLPLAA